MSFHYRWFSRDEELTDEFGVRQSRAVLDETPEEDEAHEATRPYARGEIASMIVAAAALVYGIFAGIASFVLFGLAFLIYEARRIVPAVFGPAAAPIANAMRGFSLVTLFGAILLLFF